LLSKNWLSDFKFSILEQKPIKNSVMEITRIITTLFRSLFRKYNRILVSATVIITTMLV